MNDTGLCPLCHQRTAYFDPVNRTWRCPCGWVERRRTRFCPLDNGLVALLLCVTIWSYPMGDGGPYGAGAQQDLEIRACEEKSQQFLKVVRVVRFKGQGEYGGSITEVVEVVLPWSSTDVQIPKPKGGPK